MKLGIGGKFPQVLTVATSKNNLTLGVDQVQIQPTIGLYDLDELALESVHQSQPAFSTNLSAFLGNGLRNLFDSGNVLPRDPATLQIALSGKAKALFNMLDPEQQMLMADNEMPFELSSVSLDTLKIMAAGALFTGTGAFTFDNEDTQSFAPLPRPEGDASFEITGLNALLDNLVAMGLVPEQDIMGPRMMMGMFARSTGDDQMAIDIDIDASGQVNVNGNRVR